MTTPVEIVSTPDVVTVVTLILNTGILTDEGLT